MNSVNPQALSDGLSVWPGLYKSAIADICAFNKKCDANYMKTMKKKRNPQDATLRNVRATRRRQAALELRLERIESELRSINSHLVLQVNRRR